MSPVLKVSIKFCRRCSLSLIGCREKIDYPLHPGVNKQALQLKCHHLLCNTVHLCVYPSMHEQIHVSCMHVLMFRIPRSVSVLEHHSQISSLSSAPELMIPGPENQQIWPPAG